MTESLPARDATAAWRSRLAVWTLALFLFLSVTGVVIWVAPGNAWAEAQTLLHTVLGIAFLVPTAIYLSKHIAQTIRQPVSHVAILGWTSGTLLVAAIVSGVVVTWQAFAGPRVSYGWDLVHTAGGVACAALVVLHCVFAAARFFRSTVAEDAKHGRAASGALAWKSVALTAALMGASLGLAHVAPRIPTAWKLPE